MRNRRKGALATFDRGIQGLLASNGRGAKIEIIAHHR
jgi:hypothetical protein